MKGYAPSVIVDNRPGAGGRLPLEALKGAEPDGSVMVLTPGDQVALFPHVYAKLGYDALRDFAPVSTVCTVQFLLTLVRWSRRCEDGRRFRRLVPCQPQACQLRFAWGGNTSAFHGGEFGSVGGRADDPRALQGRTAGRAGPPGRPDCRRA